MIYTDECAIKSYTMVCPSEREIILSLKLADYLLVQADNSWLNCELSNRNAMMQQNILLCKYNSIVKKNLNHKHDSGLLL